MIFLSAKWARVKKKKLLLTCKLLFACCMDTKSVTCNYCKEATALESSYLSASVPNKDGSFLPFSRHVYIGMCAGVWCM